MKASHRLDVFEYVLPRKIRHQRGQKSHSGAPVDSVHIAISPVPAIKTRDVYASLLDEPVVGCHDSSDRAEEDGEARHKVEQGSSGVDDLPRHHDPACCYRDEYHASSDVDVPGDVSLDINRMDSFTHFGNRVVKSFDPLMTLAERLVPI